MKKIIKLLKGVLKRLGKGQPSRKSPIQPTIIPRNEHSISRNMINRNALKVLYRLHEAGFGAYLVGGCVRDLLFGYRPKDFDIATDARPEEVRRLFKNCRLIGKRFRLAHILFGQEIIEVATFRTHHEKAPEQHAKKAVHGMILRDNVYGSLEDDVWRRDFTVNALYYNIADFSIVDYTGGMQDIKNKCLRIIGDPEQRFTEDPVRLLRAVRFLGKCNLTMSPEIEQLIDRLSHLLKNVSPARLFQEVLKLFQEGATAPTFQLLQKYQLFEQLFSQTASLLNQPETKKLLDEALLGTDSRIQEGKPVSPAFLLAVFLWRPVLQQTERLQSEHLPPYVALEKAFQMVLLEQVKQLAMPRTLQVAIREICVLQHHFNYRYGSRPYRSLEHPRFRAAYDLLLLRAKAGEPVQEVLEWWTAFHTGDHLAREKLLKTGNRPASGKKRSRRFRKKRPVIANPVK
ncbi:MAG TPA: polynucleotide adenylyltransferase PcnB [Gammaproteobacteria bacterium]|nr:polynucleotide adenylyltransferase PcnB [Gammaproteobacteria bacterium]